MTRLTPILKEMASAILYHATNTRGLIGILSDNEFHLSDNHEGGLFFMSAARSKNNAFRGVGADACKTLLVLDGNALNTKYAAHAFDYFAQPDYIKRNPGYTRAKPNSAELEDRIYSHKAEIPDAARYIKEVHHMEPPIHPVMVGILKWDEDGNIKKIGDLCKMRHLPVYFYDDYSAFQNLNKAKALVIK